MTERPVDVAVVGGGPAAWATAAACARLDLRVRLVAEDPDRVWPATYAAWLDELDLDDLGADVIAQRWATVDVAAGGFRRLPRAYGRLDNIALQARLRAWCERGGVQVERARVVGAAPRPGGITYVTDAGAVADATVVVDATGHPGALVRGRGPAAWQVAHGVIARTEGAAIDPGTCLLMDWTSVPGDDDPRPSFLYAMDLGDGRWLLEETVLAATAPASTAVLSQRLNRRLADRGVRVTELEAVELVRIPMGLAPPAVQDVVGVGTAGGLVHPATGYSVAASLRAAPRVAQAVSDALLRRATPAAVSAAGWAALWPTDRRRARALELFGLDALLGMGRAEVGEFFGAFFALPQEQWSGYLSGTASAREVAALMTELFRVSPWSMRRRLAQGGLRHLLGALRR